MVFKFYHTSSTSWLSGAAFLMIFIRFGYSHWLGRLELLRTFVFLIFLTGALEEVVCFYFQASVRFHIQEFFRCFFVSNDVVDHGIFIVFPACRKRRLTGKREGACHPSLREIAARNQTKTKTMEHQPPHQEKNNGIH